jgi:PAS domain S-box-containing protein
MATDLSDSGVIGASRARHQWQQAATIAAAAAVFAIDCATERGVADGLLYVGVVWLAYWVGRPRWTWCTAAVCSILIVLGCFTSPAGGELWKTLVNRALSLFATGLTAFLCDQVQRLVAQLSQRTEAAEQTVTAVVEHQEEQRRRAHALASMMEDLRAEQAKLTAEVAARQRAERRFRDTIEASPAAIVMISASGNIVLANGAAERLFGYSHDELLDRPLEVLLPDRFREQHPALRRSFFEQPESRRMGVGRELYAVRRDGHEFPVEVGLSSVATDEGIFVLSAIIDLTERKQVEEQQRELNRILELHVKQRTAELEIANAALERSNTDLQRFASVASHDLQEPLRTVGSFCQLLGERYATQFDEEGKQWLGFVVDGAKRMQEMVQALLEFARVESHGKPPKPTNVSDSLQRALANLHGAIEQCGATVTHDDMPVAPADSAQLAHVFQNLIANAIKFRGAEPLRVHVAAGRDGDHWTFSIRDNGIGIESRHFSRLFTIFQRLHRRDQYPGTGIGLALCKRIVERHGGRIWVESEPGKGTTFSFTIPSVRSAEVFR